MEDTIAAISTPLGAGGIAIIRISGNAALAVADRLFVSRHGKPSEFASHTVHFGSVGTNGSPVDQVLLTVMRVPRTYTGEDVVEINCHGGTLTARKILGLCLENGARLAEPGEFTKRAFLNGRMDLTQAEAVMDVIQARTDVAHRAAVRALEGQLSQKVNRLRDKLVGVLAHIEAHIDFPEDDINPATLEQLRETLEEIRSAVRALLTAAANSMIYRDGITIAIVGRPNAGKSSLMNALLGADRSIVTPVPGTTRDVIEESASIHGIPVRLLDTAGIREATGVVERIGVERSRTTLRDSGLVMHVIDVSRPESEDDTRLAALCSTRPCIVVFNKVDLPRRLAAEFPAQGVAQVSVSALTGAGLEELKQTIAQCALADSSNGDAPDVVLNDRHVEALRHTEKILTETLTSISQPALEITAQLLRTALDSIGEIIGKTTTDEILDRVFSSFCIGK